MFPCFPSQLGVDGTADAAIRLGAGGKPCVDGKTRAGLEGVGLVVSVAGVEGIEKGSRRHLGIRVVATGRRGDSRVDGHAGVVDETHGGGSGDGQKALALQRVGGGVVFDSRADTECAV